MVNSSAANLADERVKVAVRMREAHTGEGAPVMRMNGDAVELMVGSPAGKTSGGNRYLFKYDRCLWSSARFASGNPTAAAAKAEAEAASQDGVYQSMGLHVLNHVVSGHNATLVAYGATGSGKSFTSFGPGLLGSASAASGQPAAVSDDGSSDRAGGDVAEKPPAPPALVDEQAGLVPRIVSDLLDAAGAIQRREGDGSASVRLSVLEVLQENAYDLISSRAPLEVRESKSGIFFAEGIDKHPVRSHSEAREVLATALSRRTIAKHDLNDASSRAHTLVFAEFRRRVDDGKFRASRAVIADLAGNERVHIAKTDRSPKLMQQATNINLSLLSLGTCISVLVGRYQSGLPAGTVSQFRNSTLTKLLKDSIVGNCHLSLLCTVSPGRAAAGQTLHTLRFADQAKHLEIRSIALAEVERDGDDVALVGGIGGELPMLANAKRAARRLVNGQRKAAMGVQAAVRLLNVYQRQERTHRAALVVEESRARTVLVARASAVLPTRRHSLYPASPRGLPAAAGAAGGGGDAPRSGFQPTKPRSPNWNRGRAPRPGGIQPSGFKPTRPRSPNWNKGDAPKPRGITLPALQPKPPAGGRPAATKPRVAGGSPKRTAVVTTTTYTVGPDGKKEVQSETRETVKTGAGNAKTKVTRSSGAAAGKPPPTEFSKNPALDKVQAAIRREQMKENKFRRQRLEEEEHRERKHIRDTYARVWNRVMVGHNEIWKGLVAKASKGGATLAWDVKGPKQRQPTPPSDAAGKARSAPRPEPMDAAAIDSAPPAAAADERSPAADSSRSVSPVSPHSSIGRSPTASPASTIPPTPQDSLPPSPQTSLPPSPAKSAGAASATPLASPKDSRPASSMRSGSPSIPPTPVDEEVVDEDGTGAPASSSSAPPAAAVDEKSAVPPAQESAADDDDGGYSDDDFDESAASPAAASLPVPKKAEPAEPDEGGNAHASPITGANEAELRARLEAEEAARAAEEAELERRRQEAAAKATVSDEVRPVAPVDGSEAVGEATELVISIETTESITKLSKCIVSLKTGAAAVTLDAGAAENLRNAVGIALNAADATSEHVEATVNLIHALLSCVVDGTHARLPVGEWCAGDEWLDSPVAFELASQDARALVALLQVVGTTSDVHRSVTVEWAERLLRRDAAAAGSSRPLVTSLLGGWEPSPVVRSTLWAKELAPLWLERMSATAKRFAHADANCAVCGAATRGAEYLSSPDFKAQALEGSPHQASS